ncbi:hypothetical protein ACSSVZ_001392 [Amorphus sp. MBR-141]
MRCVTPNQPLTLDRFPLPGHSRQEWRSTIEPGETLVEGFRYLILAAAEPESELVTSCWFASRNGM